MRNKKILIIGSAGFIGFHLSKLLIEKNQSYWMIIAINIMI